MKKILLSMVLLLTLSGFRVNNDIVLSGSYTNLIISQSGSKSDPIIVAGNNSHIQCLKITGSWVYVSDVVAEWCQQTGVVITGRNVRFENSIVTDNAQVYGGAGWCEGVPEYHGITATKSPVLIKGNTVYNNCGHGIHSTTASIENNSTFNNYVTNIYGTIVKSNVSECVFSPVTGIEVIGNVNVYQNYVSGCGVGIAAAGTIYGNITENAVVGDTRRLNFDSFETTANGNHTTIPIIVENMMGVILYDNYLFE